MPSLIHISYIPQLPTHLPVVTVVKSLFHGLCVSLSVFDFLNSRWVKSYGVFLSLTNFA